jgi:hypothetical protein
LPVKIIRILGLGRGLRNAIAMSFSRLVVHQIEVRPAISA